MRGAASGLCTDINQGEGNVFEFAPSRVDKFFLFNDTADPDFGLEAFVGGDSAGKKFYKLNK